MNKLHSFGERLAQCRTKLGLSQAELSEQLRMSKSTLAMYETNKREPNLETLNNLSEKLGVSLDYLIAGKEMDIEKLLSNHWGAIPHVREITYEDPITTHMNIETYFSTPFSWLDGKSDYLWYTPKEEDYIAKINGLDPWVLIELQTELENGDLAAVCIHDGSAVLRRVYFSDDNVTLIPYNPQKDTPPSFHHKEDIKIRGKVMALLQSKLLV
ncbi:helix-turn-helix domain-containing protein [Ammoniphilus sp. 3BR4]|uniref:helix-turn-helix domain-containing protein n=1 Tax=Ammoniphilus sp. 3BR4 TaxID=3158265 RepID=UPI0034666FEF